MKISIIGYGNLGKALKVLVEKEGNHEIRTSTSLTKDQNQLLIDEADVVFLTFKPKDWMTFGRTHKFKKGQIIISFLAGVNLDNFPREQSVIRCVTNIGIKYGVGSLILTSNQSVTEEQKDKVKTLFPPVLQTWLDQEIHCNALTVLVGSTPAFLARVYSSFQLAAQQINLPQDLTASLLQQTIIATTTLISSSLSYDEIISSVQSKGGITEKGLDLYSTLQIDQLFQSVFSASFLKCQQLNPS